MHVSLCSQEDLFSTLNGFLLSAVHMIFRFLCGFAGSAFLSVAGGTVADLFENDKLGT